MDSEKESGHRTPHWVKVTGILAILVALTVAAALVFGNGEHGPGRHSVPDDEPGGDAGPDDGGHTPPDHGESVAYVPLALDRSWR